MSNLLGIVVAITCPECSGAKKVGYGTLTCGKCGGKGSVQKTVPVTEIHDFIANNIKK